MQKSSIWKHFFWQKSTVQGPNQWALQDQHIQVERIHVTLKATLIICDFFQFSCIFNVSFFAVMMKNLVINAANRADYHLPWHTKGCLFFMKFTFPVQSVLHANNQTNDVERIQNIERQRDPSLFPQNPTCQSENNWRPFRTNKRGHSYLPSFQVWVYDCTWKCWTWYL